MTRVTFLLVLLSACGGAQSSGAAGGGPDCDAVAGHMLDLANADNGGQARPDTAAGIVGELRRQCVEDGWTLERRRCLMAAETQEDTLGCPHH